MFDRRLGFERTGCFFENAKVPKTPGKGSLPWGEPVLFGVRNEGANKHFLFSFQDTGNVYRTHNKRAALT